MTKTEARKQASRQLSYGHFQPRPGIAWVTCPQCRGRVTVEFVPWKGSQPFLRLALVSHLVEEH
jgi:hypothetical protein